MNLPQIPRVCRGWIRGLEYGTRREVQRFSLISRRRAICELMGHRYTVRVTDYPLPPTRSLGTRLLLVSRARSLPLYLDFPRRERARLFYLYTLMRSGSGARSTTNSGCSRRNVSATWQFQQTGRCVFIVSRSISVGISLHSTVFRPASTSAGG